MAKKERKLLYDFKNVAVHYDDTTGEYFLYDNINHKYIGDNDGDSYTEYFHNNGIIYLETEDKKCTIYSVHDKKNIVYRWPFLLNNYSRHEYLFKNPETGKFRVFIEELYRKNNGLFEREFDDATPLTGKIEKWGEFNIRLRHGDTSEYCNEYGIITELSGHNVEVIRSQNIIDKKDGKERFILRCGYSYDAYTSPFYNHVCVSHMINNTLRIGETYLISCMGDNETTIYECPYDGVSSTIITTFKTQKFDSVTYISTMQTIKGSETEPYELLYFFLGRRDGKRYLLYATKTGENRKSVEQDEPINLSEPIEITEITECGKDARVLHTIDGKQALIQCHECNKRKEISMTLPEYIDVTRLGEEMSFILNKGITPANKGMAFDIFDSSYVQRDCSIIQYSENFIISIKDFTWTIYKNGKHGLGRYSLPFDSLIPYGEKCYLGYNNGKQHLVALSYEDLGNVAEIGVPKGEQPIYVHIMKVNGKYHCVLGDFNQVIDEDKPYLNYPTLYNCYGGLINAVDENNKSTLFTWQGKTIISYDQFVNGTYELVDGEKIWTIKGDNIEDYFKLENGTFVRTSSDAFKKRKS